MVQCALTSGVMRPARPSPEGGNFFVSFASTRLGAQTNVVHTINVKKFLVRKENQFDRSQFANQLDEHQLYGKYRRSSFSTPWKVSEPPPFNALSMVTDVRMMRGDCTRLISHLAQSPPLTSRVGPSPFCNDIL